MNGNADVFRQYPFIHGGFVVTAFMTMSGFLITKKYYSEFATNKKYMLFMKRHILKLYDLYCITMLPYILIALIKIMHDRSFIELISFAKKLIMNFLMIQSIFPNGQDNSINGVSWYFSCIIIIYAIFPLLVFLDKRFVKRKVIRFLLILFCLTCIFILEPVEYLYANPLYRINQFIIGMQISLLVDEFCVTLENKIKILIEIFILLFGVL